MNIEFRDWIQVAATLFAAVAAWASWRSSSASAWIIDQDRRRHAVDRLETTRGTLEAMDDALERMHHLTPKTRKASHVSGMHIPSYGEWTLSEEYERWAEYRRDFRIWSLEARDFGLGFDQLLGWGPNPNMPGDADRGVDLQGTIEDARETIFDRLEMLAGDLADAEKALHAPRPPLWRRILRRG